MNLDIALDKKYYKSNSIANGRVISKFFESLSKNIFNQSYRFWKNNVTITGTGELPILYGERNLYSMFAVAIDKITPVHLSEWSFNQAEYPKIEKTRRVDFWCLNKDGESGSPVNYFIEIKKGWYCLNKNSNDDFQQLISNDIKSLSAQTLSLKKISPQWSDVDDVFLGVSIIHGYYREGKEYYDETQVRENIYNNLDKRHNLQLIISTWTLPESMNIQWEENKCRFISVAGIVLSKKR